MYFGSSCMAQARRYCGISRGVKRFWACGTWVTYFRVASHLVCSVVSEPATRRRRRRRCVVWCGWTSTSGPNMLCFFFDYEMCFAPQLCALFPHPNLQKWSDHVDFFPILTLQRASHHSGVHFLNISTSKSSPGMVRVLHFDLEMCFAPQRRALFQQLDFQKFSENGVLLAMGFAPQHRAVFRHLDFQKCSWGQMSLAFWLGNVFRVQFFISHLARWLRIRRFSEPTFRSSGATKLWKNSVFCDFSAFSRAWTFFLLTLSLLCLLPSHFLFFDSSHLGFSICPYYRKFVF